MTWNSFKEKIVSEDARELTKRIIHWFFFDTFFALIPLILSSIFRAWAGKPSEVATTATPELVFFVLVTTGLAMGNIREVSKPLGWDALLAFLFVVFLFGAIFAAVFYGAILSDREIAPIPNIFKESLYIWAKRLAIWYASASLATEVIVTRLKIAENGARSATTV